MNRRLLCLIALLLTAALLLCRLPPPNLSQLPGARTPERRLISIWMLSSIGGGQAWLKQALRRYEHAHPGVMTYLRQANAAELTADGAVLPDLLLYMPGDLAAPEGLSVLSGPLPAAAALLRCGQYEEHQYGMPLCWGAYVMAVDSRLEPGSAVTPAPTTLLGKPVPTEQEAAPSAVPGYPLAAAMQQPEPLQCAPGIPCIVLRQLLPEALPALPSPLLSQTQVYARFLDGSCASAVLTTGQATALESAIRSGKAGACRILVPGSIVTDQVWLGSLTAKADQAAAELLAWLFSPEAQQLLETQQLQPAREGIRLYADGWPAEVANAAIRRLTAVGAFQPCSQTGQTVWQVLCGQLDADQAADLLQ